MEALFYLFIFCLFSFIYGDSCQRHKQQQQQTKKRSILLWFFTFFFKCRWEVLERRVCARRSLLGVVWRRAANLTCALSFQMVERLLSEWYASLSRFSLTKWCGLALFLPLFSNVITWGLFSFFFSSTCAWRYETLSWMREQLFMLLFPCFALSFSSFSLFSSHK